MVSADKIGRVNAPVLWLQSVCFACTEIVVLANDYYVIINIISFVDGKYANIGHIIHLPADISPREIACTIPAPNSSNASTIEIKTS